MNGALRRWSRGIMLGIFWIAGAASKGAAQESLTWEQVREKFEAQNPSLRAAQIAVEEAKAAEITAFLRPNPTVTLLADQIDPFTTNPFRPFYDALPGGNATYLHERQHKRELRRQSAEGTTAITNAQQADLQRTLLFTLRAAFVQTLQQKEVRELARENLGYYDKLLKVNQDRYDAGAIAQVDLDRLELQRVQFQADLQAAEVSLRTAKIQLLMLLNERIAVDQFDVNGPFDILGELQGLEEIQQIAMDARPDLRAAIQTAEKARTDHKLAMANGSTDPTFGIDAGKNPPLEHYVGFSVSIPLRIFDRNQGEKLRSKLEVERSSKLEEVTRAQVFSDVDTAYATVSSTESLLRPYKSRYLQQAVRVRDTIAFSYQHGAASLLDFLDAEKEYRDVRLNYLNLMATYLNAAAQLNLAVGREVTQ